jgi:hypothetical protein
VLFPMHASASLEYGRRLLHRTCGTCSLVVGADGCHPAHPSSNPRGEVCGVTQKNYLACLISKYMSKVSSDHSLMSYDVTV